MKLSPGAELSNIAVMPVRPEQVAQDYVTLAGLHEYLFPGDDLPDLTRGWWFVAYDLQREQPVGFAGVTFHGSQAFLARGGVLQEYRRKGLHQQLIRLREDFALSEGYGEVVTYTYENEASVRSLLKAGYEVWDPPWGPEGCVYLRKTLQPQEEGWVEEESEDDAPEEGEDL